MKNLRRVFSLRSVGCHFRGFRVQCSQKEIMRTEQEKTLKVRAFRHSLCCSGAGLIQKILNTYEKE